VDSSNFNFYSYPRFASSALSESTSKTNYNTNSGFIGIFGGRIDNSSTTVYNSFQGIIHTVVITSGALTTAQIASSYLVPTTSSTICDYFISAFRDLGVQDASNAFTNSMYGYNSQSQQFTNSLASTVDAVNGLNFAAGQTQTITNVVVTAQRAIGVQFW